MTGPTILLILLPLSAIIEHDIQAKSFSPSLFFKGRPKLPAEWNVMTRVNTSKRSIIFKPDTIFHTAPREMSAIPLCVKYVLSLTGDRTASMTDMFIKPVVCRTDNLPS